MIRPAQITFLLTILLLSTGLTLGFTYLPCYASLCSESYLPYETRLHIATFYGLLASTGCFLFLTSLSPAARRLSNIYISQKELPLLNKRLTLGGIALTLWILGLVLATTAFWVEPQLSYWERRTGPLDWAEAKLRLAVTGIIGHHADLLLGLVIIPVSRNSIMGRVFAVQQSALLFAHKMLAYLLFVAALAHGAAYYVSTFSTMLVEDMKFLAFRSAQLCEFRRLWALFDQLHQQQNPNSTSTTQPKLSRKQNPPAPGTTPRCPQA